MKHIGSGLMHSSLRSILSQGLPSQVRLAVERFDASR